MKMDILMEQAGLKHRYQFILASIIWFFSISCYIPMTGIPFFLKRPVLDCKMKNDTTFTQCTNEMINDCDFTSYEMIINNELSFDNFATSFNLFCEKDIYISLYPAVLFSGALIAVLSLSSAPDKYGRLFVMKMMALLNVLSHTLFLFSNGPIIILFTGFISGICCNFFSVIQVVTIEFFHVDYSAFVMSMTNAIFPLSGIIVIFFYMFFNSWRGCFAMSFVCSIIACFLLFNYCIESPRWLYSKNQHETKMKVLFILAEINGRKEEFVTFCKENKGISRRNSIEKEQNNKIKILQLFESDKIRHNVIHLSLQWFISACVFYSLIYYLDSAGGDDLYIFSLLVYSAEFIAEVSSGYFADKFGRKTAIQFYYFAAGICFIWTNFVKGSVLKSVLIFVSSGCASSSLNIFYIYSPELFPTSIRSTATSFTYIFSRMSAAITPLLYRVLKTPVFYGGLSIFSGLLMFKLQETLGKELEDYCEGEFEIDGEIDLIEIKNDSDAKK